MFWLHRHLPAKQALNSKQSTKGYKRIIQEILRISVCFTIPCHVYVYTTRQVFQILKFTQHQVQQKKILNIVFYSNFYFTYRYVLKRLDDISIKTIFQFKRSFYYFSDIIKNYCTVVFFSTIIIQYIYFFQNHFSKKQTKKELKHFLSFIFKLSNIFFFREERKHQPYTTLGRYSLVIDGVPEQNYPVTPNMGYCIQKTDEQKTLHPGK